LYCYTPTYYFGTEPQKTGAEKNLTYKKSEKKARRKFKYKYNGKELQDELGLNTYDYQWRDYDAAIARFNNIDRFAEKYHSLTPYHFTANNPMFFREIAGDSIFTTINKGGGENGRDLMTIHVTGKIIDFSKNNVDMEKALKDITAYMEETYQGEDVEGYDVNMSFEFSIANSMDDVDKSDHLIVFAEPTKENNDNVSGVVNMFGGKVAVVDADYFTGFYDKYIGNEGERTTAHEMGHLFGLRHVNNPFNLMSQGRSELRGSNINNSQLKSIYKNLNKLNQGSNTNFYGAPNLSPTQKRFFDLYSTYGRFKKR